MDHETCSARLPGLVRGELGDEDRRAVEAHLAGCSECTRELSAVRALMAVPEVELTGDERRALHQAVLTPRRSPWARLAPALGAVGLLVVVAVGVTSFLQGRDDPQTTAIQDEPGAARSAAQEAEHGRAGVAGGDTTDAAAQPATADSIKEADTGGGTVEAFSAEGLAVATFSTADLGPHLLADRDTSTPVSVALRRLSRNAPGVEPQISACTTAVQRAYDVPLTPAFASVYPADELLVMGFVFGSGSELRYAFWGWRLGDCTRPTPIYLTGAFE